MKALLILIVFEWKTLLKGLFVVFLIIFPFTFLPILVSDGFDTDALLNHLPWAALFTFLFSLFILGAALMKNVQSLYYRKKIFDMPAFEKLDFYGRFLGSGSISKDLESMLVGRVNKYYFRIRIENPENENIMVEITPLIDYVGMTELKEKLISNYMFAESDNDLLVCFKSVSKEELKNENLLLGKLKEFEDLLLLHKAVSLDINDEELNEVNSY